MTFLHYNNYNNNKIQRLQFIFFSQNAKGYRKAHTIPKIYDQNNKKKLIIQILQIHAENNKRNHVILLLCKKIYNLFHRCLHNMIIKNQIQLTQITLGMKCLVDLVTYFRNSKLLLLKGVFGIHSY